MSSITFYQHSRANQVLSLPSNIEQMDLTRMLMEHLSEHTQIKNIKVVRDSKGGVCAFVQCEVRIFFLIFVVKKLTYICAPECNLRYSFDTDFTIQCPQAISRPQSTLRACKGIQDTTCVLSVFISLLSSQSTLLTLSQHSHSNCAPWHCQRFQ